MFANFVISQKIAKNKMRENEASTKDDKGNTPIDKNMMC